MASGPMPREEYVRDQVQEHQFGVVNKPLTTWQAEQSAARPPAVALSCPTWASE